MLYILIHFDRFGITKFFKSGWCLAGAKFLIKNVFFKLFFTIFHSKSLYVTIFDYIPLYLMKICQNIKSLY